LHADNTTYYDGMPVTEALWGQILFWVPFDSFRPYMAKQHMIPRGNNDIERVTFDEFFVKKLYSSYLVGASNVYDRMIPDYVPYSEDAEEYHAEIFNLWMLYDDGRWSQRYFHRLFVELAWSIHTGCGYL
jgi:hypothetical protein